MVEQQYVSGTVGYPDEFSLQPPDEDKLRALAAGTGGKFNPAPSEILQGDSRRAEVERELWPWLLIAALFVFVADVAARRWPKKGVRTQYFRWPGQLVVRARAARRRSPEGSA